MAMELALELAPELVRTLAFLASLGALGWEWLTGGQSMDDETTKATNPWLDHHSTGTHQNYEQWNKIWGQEHQRRAGAEAREKSSRDKYRGEMASRQGSSLGPGVQERYDSARGELQPGASSMPGASAWSKFYSSFGDPSNLPQARAGEGPRYGAEAFQGAPVSFNSIGGGDRHGHEQYNAFQFSDPRGMGFLSQGGIGRPELGEMSALRSALVNSGQSQGELQNMLGRGVYADLISHGGIDPSMESAMRARGNAPINAAYAGMEDAIREANAVRGGAGNAGAVASALARSRAGALGDQALSAELGLHQQRQQNRLQGAAGLQQGQGTINQQRLAGLGTAQQGLLGQTGQQIGARTSAMNADLTRQRYQSDANQAAAAHNLQSKLGFQQLADSNDRFNAQGRLGADQFNSQQQYQSWLANQQNLQAQQGMEDANSRYNTGLNMNAQLERLRAMDAGRAAQAAGQDAFNLRRGEHMDNRQDSFARDRAGLWTQEANAIRNRQDSGAAMLSDLYNADRSERLAGWNRQMPMLNTRQQWLNQQLAGAQGTIGMSIYQQPGILQQLAGGGIETFGRGLEAWLKR